MSSMFAVEEMNNLITSLNDTIQWNDFFLWNSCNALSNEHFKSLKKIKLKTCLKRERNNPRNTGQLFSSYRARVVTVYESTYSVSTAPFFIPENFNESLLVRFRFARMDSSTAHNMAKNSRKNTKERKGNKIILISYSEQEFPNFCHPELLMPPFPCLEI